MPNVNIYDLADTWNNGATTFTAIKMNVTDTASNAASLLMDLQVGGASMHAFNKSGQQIHLVNPTNPTITPAGSLINGLKFLTTSVLSLYSGGLERIRFGAGDITATAQFGLGATAGAPDVLLLRDAANTLAQRNGTNAQAFRVYNTYADAGSYERGFSRWNANVYEIGTEAAGTGTVRALSIYTGTKERINLSAAGRLRLYDNSAGSISYVQIDGSGDNGAIGYYDNALGFSYSLYGDSSGAGGSAYLAFGSGAVVSWQSTARQDGGSVDLTIDRVAANILGLGATYTTGGAAPAGGSAIQMREMTAPAAGAADSVRIFAQDNGAGKTQLMAIFATGAAQQIAIQP